MTEKIKFVLRIMFIHMATYILCGIVFDSIFNYQGLFKFGSDEYFMKEFLGTSTLLGPLLQVSRGILFGMIFLVIGRGLLNGKNAWIKLWIVIAGIGIINTPGANIGSIEGVIYTTNSLAVHIKGSIEILVQTLLFSYLVCKKRKKNAFLTKNHDALISMLITGVSILLCYMFISIKNNIDINIFMSDKRSFIVIIIAIIVVFASTKWMEKNRSNFSDFIWMVICYISNAILPAAYNYLTNSPFKTRETLFLGIIPIILIWCLVKRKNRLSEK